jgi:hypothetical protein
MRSAKAVISEKFARLGSPTATMAYTTAPSQRGPSHTLTSLKRWSVATRELPGERAGCTSEDSVFCKHEANGCVWFSGFTNQDNPRL